MPVLDIFKEWPDASGNDDHGRGEVHSGREKKYDVFIHKSYFPKTSESSKPGKEDFEQWQTSASSRSAAAHKIWAEHGPRLLSLMNPHEGSLPRKVSLHVGNPLTGTGPGRLNPITVHPRADSTEV